MVLHQSVLGKVDTALWTLLRLVNTGHKVRTQVLTLTRVPTTVRAFNVDEITDIDMYLCTYIHKIRSNNSTHVHRHDKVC